jgi:hypothetical protein
MGCIIKGNSKKKPKQLLRPRKKVSVVLSSLAEHHSSLAEKKKSKKVKKSKVSEAVQEAEDSEPEGIRS